MISNDLQTAADEIAELKANAQQVLDYLDVLLAEIEDTSDHAWLNPDEAWLYT